MKLNSRSLGIGDYVVATSRVAHRKHCDTHKLKYGAFCRVDTPEHLEELKPGTSVHLTRGCRALFCWKEIEEMATSRGLVFVEPTVSPLIG